jgi:hypothetical protein
MDLPHRILVSIDRAPEDLAAYEPMDRHVAIQYGD